MKHRDPLVAKTGDKIPVVKSGDKKDKVSIQELEPVVKSGDQSKVGPLVESGDQSKGAKATTVLVRTLGKPSDEPRVKVSQRPDVESGEGVRKFSLGSKPVEKPRAMLKLKATLSNDALERSGNKENDKRDLELCTQLTTRTHKVCWPPCTCWCVHMEGVCMCVCMGRMYVCVHGEGVCVCAWGGCMCAWGGCMRVCMGRMYACVCMGRMYVCVHGEGLFVWNMDVCVCNMCEVNIVLCLLRISRHVSLGS